MDNLSPVLRKLSGIAGRRRMEDEEFQDEAPLLDLSGLRPPPTNDYIPDMINGGTVPERYDVRANSVMMPIGNMQQQQPEMLSAGPTMNMGGNETNEEGIGRQILRGLTGLAGVSLLDNSENIAKKSMSSAWSPLQSLGEGMVDTYQSTPQDGGEDIPMGVSQGLSKLQSLGEGMAGIPPTQNEIVSSPPIEQMPMVDQQAERMSAIDQAEPAPAEVVFGATDQVAQRPDLLEKVEKILGSPMTEEMKEATTRYEKILSDLDQNLTSVAGEYDAQMQATKDRILANQPTEMDKFYVGLALVMPAVLGGLFGKEVGLASLGGGLQGLSKGMDNRQKALSTEADRLADITTKKAATLAKKGELDLERMKIPEAIKKAFPDEREHLQGMTKVKLTDPETGEQIEGVRLKPNLIANEEYLSDKEAVKSMRKTSEELAEMTGETKEFAKNAKETAEILKEIKDSPALSRILESAMLEKLPKWAIDSVEKVNYKGKMVNPYTLLHENYKKMADQYRRVNKIRASLGDREATKDIMPNLYSMALNSEDAIDAVLNQLNLMEERALSQVESQGFYRRPMEEEFAKIRRDVYSSVNKAFEKKESGKGLEERRYKNAK